MLGSAARARHGTIAHPSQCSMAARNARAVAALCPDDETAALVLAGNAARVYHLKLPA